MESLPVRHGEAYEKAKNVGGRKNRAGTGNLREQVVHQLPTPMANSPMRNSRRSMVTHPTKRSGVALNQAIELMQGILPKEFESWDEVPASMLPTPTVSDQYTANLASTQQKEGSMHSVTLAQVVNRADLLPTPNTMEHLPARTGEAKERQLHRGGSKSRRSSSGNLREDVLEMLPTPVASEGTKAPSQQTSETKSKTGQVWLSNAAKDMEISWGKFEPAIRRWESVLGRLAPAPTNPDGKDGNHRLSSKFTEWMMGLPDGWITNAGLTRNEELKACGNGVVPQQAELALRQLLKGIEL